MFTGIGVKDLGSGMINYESNKYGYYLNGGVGSAQDSKYTADGVTYQSICLGEETAYNASGAEGATEAEKQVSCIVYFLQQHPEGIWLWSKYDSKSDYATNSNAGHAIVITDYEIVNGKVQLYVIDPVDVRNSGKGRIRMENSYFYGECYSGEQIASINIAYLAKTDGEGPVNSEVASGTCGADLRWVLDDTGKLTISGTGEMYDYYGQDDLSPWKDIKSSIKTVEIKSGVTSIGDGAFSGLGSLTKIDIPASVVSIGHSAFWLCTKLTSVVIPYGVTSIEKHTFYECHGLISVDIPDSVTSIGEGAFSSCENLRSIEIPQSVTSIENRAFDCCFSLTSVVIPNRVTAIEERTFESCVALKSVVIPDGVTFIGEWAFAYCGDLSEITLPSSLTSALYLTQLVTSARGAGILSAGCRCSF